MRPAFGDWRSLVAHFVRDEGVGGSNPLSPTNSEKPAYGLAFCCPEFNEDENLRGQEVRLERSERTLREQRPEGRATQWRVILYHRPIQKSQPTGWLFAARNLTRMSIVGLISAAPSGRIGRPLSATPDGGAGALSGLRRFRHWQKMCITSHCLFTFL